MPDIISGFAFHVHHDVLVEYCTDYQERVDYIKERKPANEQGLRLRLFKMIPIDRVPPVLVEAGKAYVEAGKAYEPAELIKLHTELCPECTWDEKQKTIFPREGK